MIIVTGGAGFIGSAFVAHLNSTGREDIIIVDNLNSSEKWRNLVNLRFNEYYHKDDFLQRLEDNTIRSASIDAVVHMGACSSTTETDADYLMYNNFHYTKQLAEWAVYNRIRFIYASSAATYGSGGHGFSDDIETMQKLKPINRYGYSKQLFDRWAHSNDYLREIAGLKFFNVYGPNEYHKGHMSSVIYKAYHQVLETGKIKLFKSYREEYGDGEQKRDFIYVNDINKVMQWLLDNPAVNGIFNLGTGHARTWNDLAHAVFNAMDKDHFIDYIEMPEEIRDAYQYFTQADMSHLREAGYIKDFTSLEKGVADYIQNYLSQSDPFCGPYETGDA